MIIYDLKEEEYLEQFMPLSFKSCCPICNCKWTVDVNNIYGIRYGVRCSNQCFKFAWTHHFVQNEMDGAWRRLWRNFVKHYGLAQAIKIASKQD